MNEIDSEASTKAIDSLLNYETVKYFGNEAHEARRFDEALARYERAAVRSQVTLNMLNLGQALIIAVGPGADHAAGGATAWSAGTMTVGEFVLVNTYLMQLYQPLNFLGFVYREIKQGAGRHGADVPPAGESTQEVAGPAGRAGLLPPVDGGRRGRVRGRAFRLPAGPRDPARASASRVPAGRQAGDRRADRRRQIDHQPPAVPLLRRDRRPRS